MEKDFVEYIFHVVIGIILGVSFMLVGIGLDKTNRLSFWIGIFCLIIGIYLFFTV